MPELNIPLFQKIHAQITQDPGSHYQGSWETVNECGTTRCLAGWALHFEAHGDVYQYGGGYINGWSAQVRTLIDSRDGLEDWYTVSQIAKHLLGLTSDQAGRLFYADEERAAEAVRLAAEGDLDGFDRLVDSVSPFADDDVF